LNLNIYELVFGHIRHFVAAVDEEDAYAQGTDPERFPDLHFRPFEIHKVEVQGYTITVTQNAPQTEKEDVTEADEAPRRGRRKAAV